MSRSLTSGLNGMSSTWYGKPNPKSTSAVQREGLALSYGTIDGPLGKRRTHTPLASVASNGQVGIVRTDTVYDVIRE